MDLRRGSPIPAAAPEDGEAHGAAGTNSRNPPRQALVLPSVGFGRVAQDRCKLFSEGQQGCAATLLLIPRGENKNAARSKHVSTRLD